MKLLVIGAAGQVGTEVVAQLDGVPGHELTVPTRDQLDLARPPSIAPFVDSVAPDVVINCAAYNAVDQAEDEIELAMTVNGTAVAELAAACARHGAFLVHISTDYVFDGTKGSPYDETDEPNPQSVYGRSKLAGEEAVAAAGCDHAVVRTAWVFGRIGRSLVEAIVDRIVAGEELRMVDDQTGSPTHAGDLASTLIAVGTRRLAGLYHATNAGTRTPYDLAREIAELLDVPDAAIEAITTEELGRPAPRPTYSALASVRLEPAGVTPLRPLSDALDEVVSQRAAARRSA